MHKLQPLRSHLTWLNVALFLVACLIGSAIGVATLSGISLEAVGSLAAALGTIALAYYTRQSVVTAGLMAEKTAAMAEATRESTAVAERAERLRFTDDAILQMVQPEMREALNNLQGDGVAGDMALAARMYAQVDLTSPVNEREEPGRSYMQAVGLYINLFDRISAYADADMIDEDLYFTQYDWLVTYLYFLFKDYLWEPGKRIPSPNVTKFATRAFLHAAQAVGKPSVPSYALDFYAVKARMYYPGNKTEQVLAKARLRDSH